VLLGLQRWEDLPRRDPNIINWDFCAQLPLNREQKQAIAMAFEQGICIIHVSILVCVPYLRLNVYSYRVMFTNQLHITYQTVCFDASA